MCVVECKCIGFIDQEGFGDCIKQYKHKIGCYVQEPSNCKDTTEYWGSLGNSGDTRLGLYSFSEACDKQVGEYPSNVKL